ncbi:hypothetical protein DFJ77DRAFT_323589 [Powellomyces hirtus]|nr:hypothetical protein DFJ77DRAFT_515647 [Powellomyces hirtus]KAI8917904.1 hypothetical protein DFJ77DRAFT_323589 [Powellomyces hirtus]
MPSLRSLVLSSAVVLLSASVSAQSLGGVCGTGDNFACQGTQFLSCENGRWVVQNDCVTQCLSNPAFASQCSNNTQVGPGGAANPSPSPTPRPPATTNTPAQTSAGQPSPTPPTTPSTPSVPRGSPTPAPSSSDPASSPDSASGGSKSNAGAIAGGIVGALAVLALLAGLFFFWRRRNSNARHPDTPMPPAPAFISSGKAQEEGMATIPGGSSSSSAGLTAAGLSVASVLEKKYVVRHEYQPAAEDEVQLKVGDRIRMDLLFNDGWAKGTNESTGQQGLLPVACLQEA